MPKWVLDSAVIAFLLVTPCMKAELASIHRDKLPQSPTVLSALDDAIQLEPCTDHYSAVWNCEISKDDAVARLSKDLGFLQAASKEDPNNSELQLLIAEVAHYAYNVEVTNSYDLTLSSLKRAGELTPGDYRIAWFRADQLCQTAQPKAGADEFLTIEATHPPEQLPPAFWDNYISCALVTGLPVHAKRALDHIKSVKSYAAELNFYRGILATRFTDYDPNKKYEPKEVWYASNLGDDVVFTATACGIRLHAHKDWHVERIEFAKGICVAIFSPGPYKANKGKLYPELVLIARQPLDGESLKDFINKFTHENSESPITPESCPVASCQAFTASVANAYKPNGDGKPRHLFFEKDAPEFPGLIFESPEQPNLKPGEEGFQIFRPRQIIKRFPGKIYYMVLLDTASSIEPEALKDYEFFIKNLQVE